RHNRDFRSPERPGAAIPQPQSCILPVLAVAARPRAHPADRPRSECASARAPFSLALILADPAILDLNNSVSVLRVLFVVRDLNDRGALVVEPLEQLHDFFALAGMQ